MNEQLKEVLAEFAENILTLRAGIRAAEAYARNPNAKPIEIQEVCNQEISARQPAYEELLKKIAAL